MCLPPPFLPERSYAKFHAAQQPLAARQAL